MIAASIHESDHATWHASPRPPAWITPHLPGPHVLVDAAFDVDPDLPASAFQSAVARAYRDVFDAVARRAPLRPVRFWAFLPGIHDAAGHGLDRYMIFNAGRHEAFAAHFGAGFGRGAIPTASAVGVAGRRFHLWCLAADVPATAVENPRQVPAYRYSPRFGPCPPAFARATRLSAASGHDVLLVGGTASIRGEDSWHVDGLEQQFEETCLNLASVVAAAAGAPAPLDADSATPWLQRYVGVRVYHVRSADRERLRSAIASVLSPACTVEMLPATLCRAELLVEIEGVAMAGAPDRTGAA